MAERGETEYFVCCIGVGAVIEKDSDDFKFVLRFEKTVSDDFDENGLIVRICQSKIDTSGNQLSQNVEALLVNRVFKNSGAEDGSGLSLGSNLLLSSELSE